MNGAWLLRRGGSWSPRACVVRRTRERGGDDEGEDQRKGGRTCDGARQPRRLIERHVATMLPLRPGGAASSHSPARLSRVRATPHASTIRGRATPHASTHGGPSPPWFAPLPSTRSRSTSPRSGSRRSFKTSHHAWQAVARERNDGRHDRSQSPAASCARERSLSTCAHVRGYLAALTRNGLPSVTKRYGRRSHEIPRVQRRQRR